MYQKNNINQNMGDIRKKLVMNLAVSWVIPVVLVIILRRYFASDAAALGIAGVIPAARTIFVLAWRRRVDWIGVLGIIGFGIALIITIFSGGSSLPLKLYHPMVTGIIGLILLCSVAVKKPLMTVIIKKFAPEGSERLSKPGSLKKFTYITLFLGIILIIDSVMHIIMAFALSTVEYLSMSRVFTIGIIAILVISRMYISRKNNRF